MIKFIRSTSTMISIHRIILVLFSIFHFYGNFVICSFPLLPSVPIAMRRLFDWQDNRTVASFFQRIDVLDSLLTDFADDRCSNREKSLEYCQELDKILKIVSELSKLFQQFEFVSTETDVYTFSEEQLNLKWFHLVEIMEKLCQSQQKFAETLPIFHKKFDRGQVACSGQPLQINLIQLFEYFATAEFLSHYLMTFLFPMITYRHKDTDFSLMQSYKLHSIKSINKYFRLTVDTLPEASRDLISYCNPSNNSQDSQFIEMKGFRQAIIVKANAACDKVNGRSGIDVCSKKRDFHVVHSYFGKFFISRNFLRNYCQPVPKGRKCTGPVIDCHTLPDMIRYFRPSKHSWKRWDVITSASGQPLMGINRDNRPSYQLLHNNAVDTRDCLCTCIDNGDDSFSKQAISLIYSESNWAKNEIVVGVRFQRKNGILYIQIKAGTLGASGIITNERWVAASGIEKRVHTLNENTGIDLDDLKILGPEILVVGVGFHISARSNRLSLGIKGMRYNYTSGNLLKNTPPKVLKYQYDNPKELGIHDSIPGKHFVKFTTSDVKSDGGQTTFPFFDAKNVEGRPSFIVVGIGIYRKINNKVVESSRTISLRIFCTSYDRLIKSYGGLEKNLSSS